MAQIKNDNEQIRAPKPIDERSGLGFVNGMWRTFTSVAQALADPDVINYRYPSMTLPIKDGINPMEEYWFDGGILDSDFVKKTFTSQNLQGVTDGTGNNTTSNLLAVTGDSNLPLNFTGTVVSYDQGGGVGTGISKYTNGVQESSLYFGNPATTLSGGSTFMQVRPEDGATPGGLFNCRLGINPAINSNEAATLGQISAGFVPYTGASTDVDLGIWGLYAGSASISGNFSGGNAALVSNENAQGQGLYIRGGNTQATDSGNRTALHIQSYTSADIAKFYSDKILSSVPVEGTSFIRTGGSSSQFLKADGSVDSTTYAPSSALSSYQLTSQKNQANGYAGLDSGAKIFTSQLPDSILGALIYQGTWDAATNTPTLVDPPASSTKGNFYVTEVAGTQFGISFVVGDWIVSNGTKWEKVDNTDAVVSVFGRIGNVLANEADYATFYPLLSGSYVNPSWITSLPYSKITNTPTTLSGYGITDAYTKTESDGLYPLKAGTGATGTWPIGITGNSGTVTNGVYTTGSYADPSWITSLPYSKITGTPDLSLKANLAGGNSFTGEQNILGGSVIRMNNTGNTQSVQLVTGHITTSYSALFPSKTGNQVIAMTSDIPAAGVTTMAAIGAVPNANGATISGTTLTLQPASASFGGLVTTGAQTFAGIKTFSNNVNVNGNITGTEIFGNTLKTYNSLKFDAANHGGFEGVFSSSQLTAARSWILPNKSGTVAMTSDISGGTVTSVTSSDGNIAVANQTTAPVLTLASTISSNTTGNAATATNSTQWKGNDYGITPLTGIEGIMAYGSGNYNFSNNPTHLRTYLGIPSGGEDLQSVAARGATTTFELLYPSWKMPFRASNADSRTWLLANDVNVFGDFAIGQSTTQSLSGFDYKLYFDKDGDIGVGTINPLYKLDVNGTGNFSGNVTASTAPNTGGHLTNKTYVDGLVNGKANLTGGNSFAGGQLFVNGTTTAIIANSEISMSSSANSTAFGLNLTSGLLLNTSGGGNGIIASDNLTAQRVYQMTDVSGTSMTLSTDTAPTTSASTGKTGTVIISGGFRYECIADNSWVRSAVSTF